MSDPSGFRIERVTKWKMVPETLTDDMVLAVDGINNALERDELAAIYSAMLQAAPTPPLPVVNTAISTIKALRAKLADAEGKATHMEGAYLECLRDWREVAMRSSALKAEIGVMREALEKWPDYWGDFWADGSYEDCTDQREIDLKIATKAALSLPLTTSLSGRMQRERAVIEAALECANALEAKLNARYPASVRAYPSMEKDYQRDMADVRAVRESIDDLTPQGETE